MAVWTFLSKIPLTVLLAKLFACFRDTIEVANFDFSASNDTEYKSFKERLREAVSSAFTRVTEEESEEGPYWSPSRKYGSMQ